MTITHEDMVQALYAIRPGAEWSLEGDSYTGLRWDDQNQTQPTEQEVLDAVETGRMNLVRQQRDTLLTQCDWTQVADAPLTTQQKADWATYRQALRDLPQTYQTAASVVWPALPGM